MSTRLKPTDPTRIETTSLRTRPCLLKADMLAGTPDPAKSLQDFFRSLPRLGSAREMLDAADALTHAALGDKHILWLIDEGTIDAGVSPLIVRMIQRGLVRQIAMTGAAAVRDYELSYYGMTHEEVGPGLEDGLLGMSRETGEGMSAIINEGVRRGFGLGECLGRGILDRQPKYFTQSILAACSARLVPSTIHVSIGSDGFHRHPNADGALLGKGSLKDAQILSARIEKLDGGGVVVAAHGSSALHEVFLLAYGASRNLAGPIKDVTLLRLGEKELDFSAVPGIETDLNVPGPLELTIPLFTGALFSLVE